MRKQFYIRALIFFALAAIVYFSLHRSERFPHQDPRAAKFLNKIDSLHLKPGDRVYFDTGRIISNRDTTN
jgi:hypothetical protein